MIIKNEKINKYLLLAIKEDIIKLANKKGLLCNIKN